MKTFVFFLVLLVSCLSQSVTQNYAGTTAGAATFIAPSLTFNTNDHLPPSCGAGAGSVPYVSFQLNDTTVGGTFYIVRGLFEAFFVDSAQVLVYSTFTPATPCTGFADGWISDSDNPSDDDQPHISVFKFWAAATYTVVITGQNDEGDYNNSGIFAQSFAVPDSVGNTAGSAKSWNPPYEDVVYPVDCGSDSGDTVQYASYSFNVSTAGTYDVSVFFSNDSYADDFEVAAALYSGSGVTIPGVDPCSPSTGAFVQSDQSEEEDDRYVTLTQVMSAGSQWTVLFSGVDVTEVGHWGVTVRPTNRADTLNSSTTFTAPYTPGDSVTYYCEAGTNGVQQYYSWVFLAAYQTYVFDVSSDTDMAAALYFGANNANPPSTCTHYLISGDTGSGGSLGWQGLVVGANYTVVLYGWDGNDETGTFRLWSLTGNQIGVISTGVSTSVSTGVSTSVSTGVSTSQATGVSTSYSTGASTGKSAASTNVASVALLFFCALVAKLF